jgi:mannosyltransferase OCH1-like enzyme
MLRKFIGDNFDDKVVKAFMKLKPYSYKADLGRYCLLWVLGGWYFDIGLRPALKMTIDSATESLLFRENGRLTRTAWGVSTGIIYSRPKNEIFSKAIELIVSHCEIDYFGATSLCPTGPNLFGRAVALVNKPNQVIFGDVEHLTPGWVNSNKAFILPSGQILAYFKQSSPGDLTEFGAQGVNNYNVLYEQGDIYDLSIVM